ncbi:hypothetical protein JXL19_11165, partial [bacterium]|nr:hypothetical protein [bacterium]
SRYPVLRNPMIHKLTKKPVTRIAAKDDRIGFAGDFMSSTKCLSFFLCRSSARFNKVRPKGDN